MQKLSTQLAKMVPWRFKYWVGDWAMGPLSIHNFLKSYELIKAEPKSNFYEY